jgi:tetratricopeptide (TPR) repeat protein
MRAIVEDPCVLLTGHWRLGRTPKVTMARFQTGPTKSFLAKGGSVRKTIAFLVILTVFVSVGRADDDPAPDDTAVCKKAMDLLSAGKQADAEKVIFQQVKDEPTVRSVFFAAVLIRSRFEVQLADRLFDMTRNHYPDTTEAMAAKLIIAIDADQSADENFNKLDDLSAASKDDALLLWMVAVECRQLNKPKVGIERYAKLLEKMDPGPVLVHQTYGNLLLDDHKPQQALDQYDIAIKLEPASWDYNCRGNALMQLKRLDDAAAAYQKATELNPNDPLPWTNWAILCDVQHDPDGAAEKRAKAAEIRKARMPK